MTAESSNSSHRGKKPPVGKSAAGGVAVLVLVAVYSVAAPRLNERFGWDLPQIQADSNGNVQMVDSREPSAAARTTQSTTRAEVNARSDAPTKTAPTKTAPTKTAPKETARTETADKQSTSTDVGVARRTTQPPASPKRVNDQSAVQDKLRYGLLREVSSDRFVSPAGLLYTPGSAEGHRLEHLRRHTKNDPDRPGSHGVFDGDMEGALKTIDRAYERAKKGQRTTKRVDDDRTIYTTDMGQRVGYVGGREGARKRNPMARRVRIVLEGNRVITAYPL